MSSLTRRLEVLARELAQPLPRVLRIHQPEPEKFPFPLHVFSITTLVAMLAEVRAARPAGLAENRAHSFDVSRFSLGLREQMLREIQDRQARG
jgi:hypothetical protein